MAAHLGGCFGAVLVPTGGNVLAPLIIWLIKKDEDAFVAHHALEALNFQLLLSIAALLAGALVLFLVGIPLLIAVGVLSLIFGILGAVEASRGAWFRYPDLLPRLISGR